MAIAGQVIANILFLLAGYAIECKYHKHIVGYPVGSKIVTRDSTMEQKSPPPNLVSLTILNPCYIDFDVLVM